MTKPLQPRTLAVSFVVAITLLSWISVTSYWSAHHLVGSFEAALHAREVLDKLEHMEVLMESAESSVRGYVITGQDSRLAPFRYAVLVVPYELRQIDGSMSVSLEQSKTWKKLNGLLTDHLAYLSRTTALRRSQGTRAAAHWILTHDGKSKRDAMDRALSKAEQEERFQMDALRRQTEEHALQTKIVLALSALVGLGLVAWVFGLLRRETGERLHAESATQITEAFLHSIVERIPYMILVKEAKNLRLTLANKAAEEWLGKPREDLVGSNEFDWLSREEASRVTEKDRRVLGEGVPVDLDEDPLRMTGKEDRILHTQKIPIPDEEGSPAYLLTISEDITQRKLAERMLQISRDAAVESARLKSEFIGNMSHEIRTPLSVMSGMTTLLLDTSLTPDQRLFATTVKRATEGLSVLSKSILDFSKIEAGTFALETQDMDVREIVDDSVKMISEQAKAKGVKVVSLVYSEIPPVLRGDPSRLRQVITQLLGNAVKFTPHGEIIVRVTEKSQTETQVALHCRISDTGIGITEEAQKHLFEAFRQGDGSPTRKFGGTGLGLAISKRIIELMGGDIGYETVPAKGSTFWFTIPVNKQHVQGPVVQASSSLVRERARALVVDENETLRQMLQKQLRTWTLSSESVSSGRTALALLRQEAAAGRPFSIVILDMHLPDMDGVILARLIKNDPALAGTKLLVMSGDESSLDASAVLALGFSGRIAKPPRPEELQERLAALVDLQKPLDP